MTLSPLAVPFSGQSRPTYLHFLDRELGTAFRFKLDEEVATRAISALVLGTTAPMHCSLSNVFENPAALAASPMLTDAVSAGAMTMLSSHYSVDEFIASHRALYAHDRERYPAYFETVPPGIAELNPVALEGGSTTLALVEKIERWAAADADLMVPSTLPSNVKRKTLGAIEERLAQRDAEAMTFTYFKSIVDGEPTPDPIESFIRERITFEYTNHHMQRTSGLLPTGTSRALSQMDNVLARESFPLRDIGTLSALLQVAGASPLLASRWRHFRPIWQAVLEGRGNACHSALVGELGLIALALDRAFSGRADIGLRREAMAHAIREAAPPPYETFDWAGGVDAMFTGALARLCVLEERLRARGLDQYLDAVQTELPPAIMVDLLVVVATDVERGAVFRAFGFTDGSAPLRRPRGNDVYFDLGAFAGRKVWLVQCASMGSGGAGGSQATVTDAIKTLNPNWVVMVGIAFGIDDTKQSLGDVLVSSVVVTYESARVGTDEGGLEDVVDRASQVPASSALLSRLRSATADWTVANVRFGAILSGEKLVDNLDYRNALQAKFRETIGGEMELAGVFSAASRLQKPWIAVKAICDFADGDKQTNKKHNQKLAADHSASFLAHAVRAGLFTN